VVVVDAQLDAVASRRRFHGLRLFDVDRHRLLDEYVRTGLHRLDGERGVRLGRRDDVDDVRAMPLEQLGERARRVPDAEARGRALGAALVRVGQPDDLRARVRERIGNVHGCDLTPTDDADLHPISCLDQSSRCLLRECAGARSKLLATSPMGKKRQFRG
jgi:hypothetical protein